MRRATLVVAIMLAVFPPAAGAQGINLALDDCGSFGHVNATPDCSMNTGIAMSIIGSVMPPEGLDRVVAVEAFIDACDVTGRTLSPWWTLDGCRAGALTFRFDFTEASYNCNDFWLGQASGGGGIAPWPRAPYRFQIKLTGATVGENPMAPRIEHYMFRVNILRSRSTSAGACAGCGDPLSFIMNYMVLVQPSGVGDYWIGTPMIASWVTYNDGGIAFGGCDWVPAQDRTWGQVKAQYR